MKFFCLFLMTAGAWVLVSGCGKETPRENELLLSVNEFHLYVPEFQNLLVTDINNDPRLKMSDRTKRDYLNEIIEKEILIQESRRLKLDQKEKFVRTIQQYWEATLIRNLVESKGQEIAARTFVTQEEIQRHYDKLKQTNPEIQPLVEIESDLASVLMCEKKTAVFQKWMDDLKQKARVKINEALLDEI